MKYIGKSFIVGIPARNLTEEEAARFGKKFLLDSGLYIDEPTRKIKKITESVKRSDLESEEE